MTTGEFRELMRRRDGSLEVALRWHPESDSVSIEVVDGRTGESRACEVPPGEALEAFEHPFSYLIH